MPAALAENKTMRLTWSIALIMLAAGTVAAEPRAEMAEALVEQVDLHLPPPVLPTMASRLATRALDSIAGGRQAAVARTLASSQAAAQSAHRDVLQAAALGRAAQAASEAATGHARAQGAKDRADRNHPHPSAR